ncbi:hypothetical protein [Cellulomonas citrea]|uniref:hypothetical protein n=1 Tax=Cellulomonas citrea TaxID=1909423 RepID=UPI001358C607|nr:hypothetical protein [Cellulomonas citrea]
MVVRAVGYQVILVGAGLCMALAAIGGLVDPPPSADAGADWWGYGIVAVSLAFAIRATRLRVVVTVDDVVVHSLLTRRRYPRSEVVTVTIANYDGFWVWDSPSGISWYTVPELTLADGQRRRARGLVGSTGGSERRAAALRAALSLPERPVARHS